MSIGYKEPLLPLILRVQATLAAINPEEIHKYIQDTDLTAINTAQEDGELALLLIVLDLSQWTRIFEVANTDLQKALGRL